MEIPKEIKKWLIYDENKFENVFKPNTPDEIKEKYYNFLEKTNDFVLDDIVLDDLIKKN